MPVDWRIIAPVIGVILLISIAVALKRMLTTEPCLVVKPGEDDPEASSALGPSDEPAKTKDVI
jgi:hypothetical protein